jgi:hypothetical protein
VPRRDSHGLAKSRYADGFVSVDQLPLKYHKNGPRVRTVASNQSQTHETIGTHQGDHLMSNNCPYGTNIHGVGMGGWWELMEFPPLLAPHHPPMPTPRTHRQKCKSTIDCATRSSYHATRGLLHDVHLIVIHSRSIDICTWDYGSIYGWWVYE